jgi:hypothetical protein
VSILLPDHETDEIVAILNDSDYYSADHFKLTDVFNKNFISAYINTGCLSINSLSQISSEPCDKFSLINGKLILNLHKDTLTSLCATTLAEFKVKEADDFISFGINLLDSNLQLQKLHDELNNDLVPKFTIDFFWAPTSENICPSSIAKYITDLNYNVKLRRNVQAERQEFGLKFPQIDSDDDEHRWQEISEYIGMVLLGCNMDENTLSSYQLPENCIDVGRGKVLHCKGFITQDTIKKIIMIMR